MSVSLHDRLENRIELGQWPSPVMDAGSIRPGLWIKNDGVCHPAYGGNKVRKLEYLLADCGPRIVTFGAAGSHHVLATAIHGKATGHEVTGVLFARPWSQHAQQVLHAATGFAQLRFHRDRSAAAQDFKAISNECHSIPAGGSTPVGALGYVRAAIELAGQVRDGELPAPKRIFVPTGTAGTLAGLAVGASMAGLDTMVIGIRVVPLDWLNESDITSLCRSTAELVESNAVPWELDDGWLGSGYGEATEEGLSAIASARAIGLNLETCYTGKALAAALAAEDGPNLYWQTHNQSPLDLLVEAAPPFDPGSWGWPRT